jgi:hypothetical protein
MGNILQDIGKPEDAVRYFSMAETLAAGAALQDSNQDTRANDAPVSRFSRLWVWNAKMGNTYYFRSTAGDSQGEEQWEVLPEQGDARPADGNILSIHCLSERPLIFEVPALMSAGECDQVVETATPLLQASHVMGYDQLQRHKEDSAPIASDSKSSNVDQEDVVSTEPFRSSFNAWLPRDGLLSKLQRRVAALTGLPSPYVQLKSEDLQVVKYDSMGQFQLHQDSSQFHPRMLTALVYLRDAPEADGDVGGETWFPFAPGHADRDFTANSTAEALALLQAQRNEGSSSGRAGLMITPSTGRAIIFFNHRQDGSIDQAALHAGRKVHSGTKWIANYWVKLDEIFLGSLS